MRWVICSECGRVPLQEASGKVAGNFVSLCPNSVVCKLMEFPADYTEVLDWVGPLESRNHPCVPSSHQQNRYAGSNQLETLR